MISSDEAFLILRKWNEDEHPLKLQFAGEGFRMWLGGRLTGIDGTKAVFFPDDDCDGGALLDLAGCDFEYGDSREAPPDSESRLKLSSILTAQRPDGILFLFAEVRT